MTDVNENPNPDEKGKNSPKGAKKPRKRNRKPKGESDSNHHHQQQQQQPSTSTTGPPAKIEGDPSKSSGDFIGKLQQLNIGSETTPKSVEPMLPSNRNDTQPLQSANRPDIKSSGNSNVNPQQGNAKNKKNPRSPKFKGIKVDDQQPSTSSAQPMPIKSFKPSGAGQVKQSKAGSVAPVKSVKNNAEGENLLKPEESDSEILAVFEENDKGEKEKKLNRNKRNIEDAYAEFVSMFKINFDGIPDSRCLRPNFKGGVIGKKVKILSNFFRLKLTGNMGYQYDIQFLKRDGQTSAVKKEVEIGRRFKRLTKRMHQILLQAFVTANPDLFIGIIYAYDNDRILITNNPLPGITNDEHLFRLTVNETVNGIIETSNYVVRIKKTVELALSLRSNNNGEENINNDRAVLQMIDIIMKTFAFQNHVVYGSKIFPFNIPRVSMNIRR
ncbi:uncharacterized protein LOC128387819, partial [Panonychus citri]|uniref:uncharacterized protein LOC128387819 n=1 Tax=Panonychus citri TaxID=50023 RepID=UPI002306EBF5